jgi:hypothetical protein
MESRASLRNGDFQLALAAALRRNCETKPRKSFKLSPYYKNPKRLGWGRRSQARIGLELEPA